MVLVAFGGTVKESEAEYKVRGAASMKVFCDFEYNPVKQRVTCMHCTAYLGYGTVKGVMFERARVKVRCTQVADRVVPIVISPSMREEVHA